MNEPEDSPNNLGGGNPARIGSHTVGKANGGTLGQTHAYPSLERTTLATVDGGYALTLEKENGDRKTIEQIIGDFDPTRDHSAISDWSVTVPFDPDELEDWTHKTRAWITWDGRVIFQGYCKSVSSSLMDGESVLAGKGPGVDLDSGVYAMDFRNVQVWRAFEQLFSEIADEWSFHVARPADPITISSFSVEGTALECIKQLADEYNWHFVVEQSLWKHVEVFKPGQLVAQANWETLDYDREYDSSGYYNATACIGEIEDDDGNITRVIEEYRDWGEIERYAADRGFDDLSKAVEMQTVREDVEDSEEAQAVARARTQEAIAEAETTGSVDTYPTMIDPGKAYPVREWDDDARIGPYSLWFDGDSRVDLPSKAFQNIQGFALWVREGSGPAVATDQYWMDDSYTLEIGDTIVEADTDDDWCLVHFDWDGETVRAGCDGEIQDTAEQSSSVGTISDAWLGFDGAAYYSGYVDYVQTFEEPLSEAEYQDIAEERDVPARKVRARYKCNEGPNRQDPILYDAKSGNHGDMVGVSHAGSPKILESVDFSHGKDTATGTLNFVKDRTLAAEINRMKREMQRR